MQQPIARLDIKRQTEQEARCPSKKSKKERTAKSLQQKGKEQDRIQQNITVATKIKIN